MSGPRFLPQCPVYYPTELFPVYVLIEPFKRVSEFAEVFHPVIFIKASMLFYDNSLSCFSLFVESPRGSLNVSSTGRRTFLPGYGGILG
jgi:hypothetical protein